MVKHDSKNVARTNNEKDVRSADRPRCVELSTFELELIAGGGSPEAEMNALVSTKR